MNDLRIGVIFPIGDKKEAFARHFIGQSYLNISPEIKHWHGAAKDSWFFPSGCGGSLRRRLQ